MRRKQISQLEFTMIDSKVENVRLKLNTDKKGYAFLHMMLEKFFPSYNDDISSLITDGGNDRGADAVYINVEGENAYVSIFQSKYAGVFRGSDKNFPGSEIDKLISLILDIMNKPDNLLESVNPILSAKISDIWGLVAQGKLISFKIYFLSNTNGFVDLERQRLEAFCKQYKVVSFEEINFDAVSALLSEKNRPREDGFLDCIDIQKFERIDCDIRGLIANVDAVSFIKMITDEDVTSIKRHLFDENIRGYLGIEGGFNKQIQNSAVSDENHLFWYLNNGITIIAKDFSHQPIRGSKIKIDDFQIVNGAQTSYSLFNAYKYHPERVSSVILLVKIFASSRVDISEKIAIATNSQARISPRDLKANDGIQKKIAVAFESNGILYERKKNQFDGRSDLPKVDSLKLGQVILAYHLSEPHQSKTGSDEIFGDQYHRIFSDKLDASYLVELGKLYLFVSDYLNNQLSHLRFMQSSSEESGFIGYAQWHIIYCMKLISQKHGYDVPQRADYDEYITESVGVIAKIAHQHYDQSFYRVFRSSKTKDLIQKELGVGQLQFEFN